MWCEHFSVTPSLASTTVYLHARDEDKRRAVTAVAAGEQYR